MKLKKTRLNKIKYGFKVLQLLIQKKFIRVKYYKILQTLIGIYKIKVNETKK